jgi:hypothetical protein
MKTVIFHNPGTLDIRGATTMGLSAKDDESAIGKFGTGLKYAIASVLRWGGAIEIETGGEKYFFHKSEILFRSKAHDQVIMVRENGVATELGYTTHYGHTWEPWQVFRELYSNARDEGGSVYRGDACLARGEGFTNITVRCERVAECYSERDVILLPTNGEHLEDDLYMFTSPSRYLYYKGVRVRDQRCVYTWNLMDGAQLTEDRSVVYTWPWESAIARYIQACTDRERIRKVLHAPEGTFERDEVCYHTSMDCSDEFLDEAETLYRQRGEHKLPLGLMEVLRKHRAHVDAPEMVLLTPIQQRQLDRAIQLVCRMNMPADKYTIEVVNLQKNTLGQAKNGKVLLSPQLFEQGTKQLVSTLFEEVLHLETGLKDCTYEMQTRLFNMLVSMYEEHVFGEAC